MAVWIGMAGLTRVLLSASRAGGSPTNQRSCLCLVIIPTTSWMSYIKSVVEGRTMQKGRRCRREDDAEEKRIAKWRGGGEEGEPPPP